MYAYSDNLLYFFIKVGSFYFIAIIFRYKVSLILVTGLTVTLLAACGGKKRVKLTNLLLFHQKLKM